MKYCEITCKKCGNPTVIVPMGDEWVSVKERLPEFDKEVLAWGRSEYESLSRFHLGYYRTNDGNIPYPYWESLDLHEKLKNVTHWIPLPEPPK